MIGWLGGTQLLHITDHVDPVSFDRADPGLGDRVRSLGGVPRESRLVAVGRVRQNCRDIDMVGQAPGFGRGKATLGRHIAHALQQLDLRNAEAGVGAYLVGYRSASTSSSEHSRDHSSDGFAPRGGTTTMWM